GGLIEDQVVVGEHEGQAAIGPALLISGAPRVVAILKRAAVWHLGIDAVARFLAGKAPHFWINLAKGVALLRGQRGVVGRNRKIRRALEHVKASGLPGDKGYRLDGR